MLKIIHVIPNYYPKFGGSVKTVHDFLKALPNSYVISFDTDILKERMPLDHLAVHIKTGPYPWHKDSHYISKESQEKANEAANKKVEPQKDTIAFDDFTKLDLRVGTIIEAEKMPKAKKLLVLKVDTGIDIRTIVSGIAESFKPEDIIGKQVTVLVNLAPRALRGVESEGMILMTENAEGDLVFVNPDKTGVMNGLAIS